MIYQPGMPQPQVGMHMPPLIVTSIPPHNIIMNQQRPSNINVVQSLNRGPIMRF